MKAWIRHTAAALLVLSVFSFVAPSLAYAAEPGDVEICATDQQGQQQNCIQVSGSIVWGSEGAPTGGDLSPGQLYLIWLFVIGSWALWDEILSSGWSIDVIIFLGPSCQNCNDGFRNAANGLPIPTP